MLGMYKSGFSPVQHDLSGKFGCLVLSGQETHMPSPVELAIFSISESCEINHSNYTYNYWMSIPSEDNFKNYEKYPSWNSVVQNDCLIQLLWKFIPNVPILAENIFFLLKVTTKVSKILPTSDKLMCEMGFSSFWFILQSTSFLLWEGMKKTQIA